MALNVEETHDRFRIELDAKWLRVALGMFRRDDAPQITSAIGLTRDEQADLFGHFAAEVLGRMVVHQDRSDGPEKMWRGLVERTSSRPCSLREVQLSLNTRMVYFWGCEIGRLVQIGRLSFGFDPVNDRALPSETQQGDPDTDRV